MTEEFKETKELSEVTESNDRFVRMPALLKRFGVGRALLIAAGVTTVGILLYPSVGSAFRSAVEEKRDEFIQGDNRIVKADNMITISRQDSFIKQQLQTPGFLDTKYQSIADARFSTERAEKLLRGESDNKVDRQIWQKAMDSGIKVGILTTSSGTVKLSDTGRGATVLRFPADIREVNDNNQEVTDKDRELADKNMLLGLFPGSEFKYTGRVSVTNNVGKHIDYYLLDRDFSVPVSEDKGSLQWVGIPSSDNNTPSQVSAGK